MPDTPKGLRVKGLNQPRLRLCVFPRLRKFSGTCFGSL